LTISKFKTVDVEPSKIAFPENGIFGKLLLRGPPAGELTENPTFEESTASRCSNDESVTNRRVSSDMIPAIAMQMGHYDPEDSGGDSKLRSMSPTRRRPRQNDDSSRLLQSDLSF